MAGPNCEQASKLAYPVGSQCHIPERGVLMRMLDPYQMACFAISGVLSDEILDDRAIMRNLWFRTGATQEPWTFNRGPSNGGSCLHTMFAWGEGVKSIKPLHYFWLCHTGCLDRFYTPPMRSDFGEWIAATVAPWHLPASFYVEHGFNPHTVYQYPPSYSHDHGHWRRMFNRLRRHDLPMCNDLHETENPEDPETEETPDVEDGYVHEQDV